MNKKITVHMKTGRKYVHFSETLDERDIITAMESKVFGLETYKGGFASYRSEDVERIEIHGKRGLEMSEDKKPVAVESTQIKNSSNIATIFYTDTNDLVVEFKNGGQYLYKSVPKDLYKGMSEAQSAGKYLNSLIKEQFDFIKLEKKIEVKSASPEPVKVETVGGILLLHKREVEFLKEVTGKDNLEEAAEQFALACMNQFKEPVEVLKQLEILDFGDVTFDEETT